MEKQTVGTISYVPNFYNIIVGLTMPVTLCAVEHRRYIILDILYLQRTYTILVYHARDCYVLGI